MANARDQVNLGNKEETTKIRVKSEQSYSETLNTQSDMKTERSTGVDLQDANEDKIKEPE